MKLTPKIFDAALNSNPYVFYNEPILLLKMPSIKAKTVRFCMTSFWVYLLDFGSTKKINVFCCHTVPRKHEHFILQIEQNLSDLSGLMQCPFCLCCCLHTLVPASTVMSTPLSTLFHEPPIPFGIRGKLFCLSSFFYENIKVRS